MFTSLRSARSIPSLALSARSVSSRAGPSTPRIGSSGFGSGSGSGSGSGPRGRRGYYAFALGGGAILIPATANLTGSSPEAEMETVTRMSDSLTSASTSSLLRSYLVYTACSIPYLIDYAPGLLSAFTNSPIPGLKTLTEWIVRHSFFAQFVPGETVRECMPTMAELRSRNVGTLLNYSAEADEAKADTRGLEKQRLEEVYRAIDAMGEFEAQAEKRGASAFALKIVS